MKMSHRFYRGAYGVFCEGPIVAVVADISGVFFDWRSYVVLPNGRRP